jgi:hypothetical protein
MGGGGGGALVLIVKWPQYTLKGRQVLLPQKSLCLEIMIDTHMHH